MKQISYLLIVLFILSCSKNDEAESIVPDPLELTNLLRTVTLNNLVFQEHNYTDDRIVMSKFYTNGMLMEKYTYDYVGDTILLRMFDNSNTLEETHKLYYVNENLSKKAVYLGENEEFAYFLNYIYDSIDCGVIRVDYTSMFGLAIYYFETNYTDQNCSNIRTTYNSENVFQSKIIKLNNDKNSPYSSVSLLDFSRKDMLNCIADRKNYTINNELIITESYTSSFEYNSLNYPTKESRVYMDGEEMTFEFSYYSK